MNKEKIYYIPARFRKIENLHILFWLIKDVCWAMNFKELGMLMIVPTMTVAIIILFQTRHILSEFIHNLAVVFWIVANCTWMIGEFWGIDENLIGNIGLRQLAIVPFGLGLVVLLYYYIFLAHKKEFQEKMLEKTEEMVKKEMQNQN
ncbi:MAG: hypothetical protein K9I82_13140 [Chitinophagaceae bacterium]|jgi:hypothetical protein|nr:hypothetical protein [Chitinophagaceae bacterium]